MEFKVSETAAKYTPVGNIQRIVHCIKKQWQGPVQDMPLHVADQLHQDGSTDVLQLKKPAKQSS
jgi:hypothetical protein